MGEIRVKSENLFDENMKQSSVRESSARGATYETVTSYSVGNKITSTNPQPASGNTISWDDSNFDIGVCYFDYVNGKTWYTQVYDIWITSSPYVCRDYPYMSITIKKKNDSAITPSEIKNAKLMLSNTALPYEPYFLNLPSHQKTSNGWKDIPTHVRTATGWQGELTSQSPLEFRATGQSLLDWRIDGASGGVGDWDETEQKYVIPVNVRGGNLYSGAWEQGYWAYSDGTAGPGLTYVRTAKMLCEGNTKYEFVCSLPDGSKDYGFVFWGANGNFIGEAHSSDVQNTPVKYSATSPANARMMAVNIARYSDGERRPADILSFDLYELHETNLYTDAQLMDGDSLDYTTDQTTIPITQGDNTLTVDTAVQPKSVFVKFEG